MNEQRLVLALDAYFDNLTPEWWEDERYKWKAIQTFQDAWDIDAYDFSGMLEQALSHTGNLLTSNYYYARAMILEFAKADPDSVRDMFRALYDDSVDVVERIVGFLESADALRPVVSPLAKQHFQNHTAISTYLWLRFPDKYFVYKHELVKAVSGYLESGHKFIAGRIEQNAREFLDFYRELRSRLQSEPRFGEFVANHDGDGEYPDPMLNTLTVDFGYFLHKAIEKGDGKSNLQPDAMNEDPRGNRVLSVEEWSSLIANPEVFTAQALEVMARMLDIGGEATCKELSNKYGGSVQLYISRSTALAKKVARVAGLKQVSVWNNNKWWPILYTGRGALHDEEGAFVWALHDELREALEKADLSGVRLYENGPRYWWLVANPSVWSFTSLEIGETEDYTLHNESGNPRRIFQNFLDAKEGDVVVGYESGKVGRVVCECRVTKSSDGERIWFEKTKELESPIPLEVVKGSEQLADMEFLKAPQGSLFKLTDEEYAVLAEMMDESGDSVDEGLEPYTRTDFLEEAFIEESRLDELIELLKYKQNVILQGAPGVGKTFAAKRLAYFMMGVKDDSRIKVVQFHQNYGYEDFIVGFKPSGEGFELVDGVFYRFCQAAMERPKEDFFFIIDEINRGNLSKIFGELMMLIEKGYRGHSLPVAGTDRDIVVPKNVYILGMMNTADRSLALIDYALRRRFSFVELTPGFEADGFKKLIDSAKSEYFKPLIKQVTLLNKEISDDAMLGSGFCIGHSYFCGKELTDSRLRAVVEYDLIPTLSEYWFDDSDKVSYWSTALRGVFK